MRYYLGHKVVSAAKIHTITVGRDALSIVDQFGVTYVFNKPDLFERLRVGKAGDYLVQYDNNYVSLSPHDPFTEGYTLLPETNQSLGVMTAPVRYRTVTGVELQVEADTFDHYTASFDVGHPHEATAYNCKEPAKVKAGDVLVTYPTGREEFLTREEFEQHFKAAPRQIIPESVATSEEVILYGGAFRKHAQRPELVRLESKVEMLSAYDLEGDVLDFQEYEVKKSSKTKPHLMVISGKGVGKAGRIIGYIDIADNQVDLSHGVGAVRVRVTY